MPEPALKRCYKCGEVKPLSAFSKDRSKPDGLQSRCKACYKASSKAYAEANRDKLAAYHRTYHEENRDKIVARKRAYFAANRDKEAARKRVYYAANRDKQVAHQRAYYAAHRDELLAQKRAYRMKNRHKARAHDLVRRALARGELISQPCERCGATEQVDAHHEDYTKPLDVVWLCRQCHAQRHIELRKQEQAHD